ncbi:DUF58 domain-containing protein [Myxococcota bacterium]|nr:DUF58 domain-containing protein [Myxococcota bacterium]
MAPGAPPPGPIGARPPRGRWGRRRVPRGGEGSGPLADDSAGPLIAPQGDPPGGWRILARIGAWILPPRTLHPTSEGLAFGGIALIVALAALNTGNNLLYLVLSMMLGFFAVSGVLSEVAMSRVRVERMVPARVHAGEPARFALRVVNPRRRFAHVALRLSEQSSPHADLRAEPAWFAAIPPGSEAVRFVEYTFRRRGRHRLLGIEVSTLYPFGLVRKRARIPLRLDVVVLPARGAAARSAASGEPGDGARPTSATGDGDVLGPREVRPGEAVRRVHWKASARLGRPVAVETSAAERVSVTVRLDAAGDSRIPAEVARFERALREATALVMRHVLAGDRVGLDAPGVRIPAGAGPAHEDRVLRALALQPPAGQLPLRPTGRRAEGDVPP